MIESQSVLASFWYRACFLMSYLSESFLSEIPEKASESSCPEFFLPKLLGPKVFDFNVSCKIFHKNQQAVIFLFQFVEMWPSCNSLCFE